MIKFGLNSGLKILFVKNFSSYMDFQEFSILGGGVLGIPPPLAIPDSDTFAKHSIPGHRLH